MIAYHGNVAEKDAILAQLAGRRMAGKVTKGVYFDGQKWAVGCTIRSADYGRFGVPKILANIDDRISEGLPEDIAKEWPERFMSAIPVGADLSTVWLQFAFWLLTEEMPKGTKKPCGAAAVAVADVVALYREWHDTGMCPDSERWRAAAHAADAYSYCDGYAAAVASAAYAAYSFDSFGGYTIRHASWIDTIKSWGACYQRMADKLIEILEAA